MPLYEYVCEQDGEVIELRRSMSEADTPVEDPRNEGRTFTRKLSTFAAKSSSGASASLPISGCPCGDPNGPCFN
ncbi:MAG: FmdB family zinc ribbon protein [Planctomycetota bacterium]